MNRIEYEESFEHKIIRPQISDFKIFKYSAYKNSPIRLPKKPKTLREVIETIGRGTKNLALKDGKTVLISFVGATGRGKNTFGELLNNYLEESVDGSSSKVVWEDYDDLEKVNEPSKSLVWVDWEEIRALMYERGAFPDLSSILTTFSNRHLRIIESVFELELAQALRDGGVILATKPAGTYGLVWDRTKKEDEVKFVDRDFGAETLRKLMNLEPPFADLNEEDYEISYTASIAVIASPFVTHVLIRYRDALQRVGGNLEAANEIQRAFKKPPFTTLEELMDKQEGGSLKGFARTNEGILKVLEDFWYQGISYAISQKNIEEALGQIQLSGDDDDLLNLQNKAVTRVMRQEAIEVANFLSENPTKHLYAEIIRSIVYEYSLSLIHESTDLQMGQFDRSLRLQPLMSMVVRNAPDMNLYKSNLEEIRRILRKYDLI
jgi:hypothetical protein